MATSTGIAEDNFKSSCESGIALSAKAEEPDSWTEECIIDELFLQLAGRKEIVKHLGKRVTIYKYYHQALALRKWIPIARPAPAFVINISDLSARIVAELKILDDPQIVLQQAVGRIFENIDPRQYHLSIAQFLEVVLE